MFPQGRIELIYNPAPDLLLRGLRTRGSTSAATAAQTIYDAYADAHKKFSALLFYRAGPLRISERTDFDVQILRRIRHNQEGLSMAHRQLFLATLRAPPAQARGINPMFKADQLVTPTRSSAMQRAADAGDYPEGEVLELYRIRGRAAWKELKLCDRGVNSLRDPPSQVRGRNSATKWLQQ